MYPGIPLPIDLGSVWQVAVNMLGSLGPLIALGVGLSVAFAVGTYIVGLVRDRKAGGSGGDSWW